MGDWRLVAWCVRMVVMKVECVRDKLETAVGRAEKITGKNLSLPVLRCVLLEARDGTLYVRSTNLDIGIEITLSVKVLEEGRVAVPADIFKSFLNSLSKDKKITLDAGETTLHVIADHSKTDIKTLPHADFPSIPQVEGDKAHVIPSQDLVDGFKNVVYASSISSMKPELASVYVHTGDDSKLIFVATDSFRLAEKKIKVKNIDDFPSVLIPFKNVHEIVRVLDEVKEGVEVHNSGNQISFRQGDVYVTSRVVDGTFPDYRQIIPSSYETEVVLLKQDLQQTLKLSQIFVDKFNQITFHIDKDEKVFKARTFNAEVGEHETSLDAVVKGDAIEMGFNERYIVECIQSIQADSVSLGFGNGKPLVIKGVGDQSFLYLVMSMNK